jgi:hypothetical protein
VESNMRSVKSIGCNAMRWVVALGLLIVLCASADAATAHRFRPPVINRPSQGVAPPGRFAVPGWSDEQTRQWLDSTRPWHQA